MASARFAWGIDIGNRALKAVKLVRDGDQIKVDDFDIIEHEHVLSNAGDNRDSLVQTALANFVQRHPMKRGHAGIGVSGQSSFARFIKLPPVEPKKIPEIVKFEAIQQIPFPLDEVEWSYQLFQSPDSPDVEVGIFAMRKDLIARHMHFFTDVALNVQVVQMNPLAVYNAVYYDQRLKGTTMVIDLGAENTDLIICDNDSVWMRSIPIGGNNFTETLVKAFKLPFGKAEDLKRNAATSKYARQIFQAMRPVFADLVAEIQRSVGFYASVHRDSRIKKIIALGGTFRLPGLQKYLQQNMSLDVERLDNISAGAPADPKLAAVFNENLLSSISAYGLALQALGEGKITSSLLPAAIRRERLWKEKTPIFAAAAASFCLGTAVALGGWWYQDMQFSRASDTRSTITRVIGEAQSLENSWTELTNSGSQERDLIKSVQGLQKYRDLWRTLLTDIQRSVPQPQQEILDGLRDNDISKIKQIPREKRRQLIIRSISAKYRPTMAQVMKDANDQDRMMKMRSYMDLSGPGAAVESAAAPTEGDQVGVDADNPIVGAGPAGGGFTTPSGGRGAPAGGERGLVLTIKCTTPMENAVSFIEDEFLSALRSIQPNDKRPTMDYSIVAAVTVDVVKVERDATRKAELTSAYQAIKSKQPAVQTPPPSQGRGPGGRPIPGMLPTARGPQPAAPAPAGAEDKAPFRDRLIFEEDVLKDTDVAIIVVVKLDPAPFVPQAQQPAAMAQ